MSLVFLDEELNGDRMDAKGGISGVQSDDAISQRCNFFLTRDRGTLFLFLQLLISHFCSVYCE
jgi:hypothetical protein